MPIPESGTYTTTLSVQQIADRVKRQFGDEANIQITEADIIRWINDAQREIAIQNNLLQNTATSSVLTGQRVYGRPDGILSLRSVHYNGRKLSSLSAQEAERYLEGADSASGEPTHFWIWATEINLFPTPSVGLIDGLKLYYTRQPVPVTELTDVPEVPAEYHNRIVEYCLQQAYELDENWQAAQTKAGQFEQGLNKLKASVDWVERDFYPSITSTDDDYYYGW